MIKIEQGKDGRWTVAEYRKTRQQVFYRRRVLKQFDDKGDAERYAEAVAFDQREQQAGR